MPSKIFYIIWVGFLVLCAEYVPEMTASLHGLNAIERGRVVYRQEGCINCHSQYVRPIASDLRQFGPPNIHILEQKPPLIGNRRTGPDLSNVGLRRGPLWQKYHLINPRSFSHKSIMPSYQFLFEDSRGEDLVEYLCSLGKENEQTYWEESMRAIPENNFFNASPERGEKLFAGNCVGCHGSLKSGIAKDFSKNFLSQYALDLVMLVNGYRDSDGRVSQESKLLIYRTIRFGKRNGNMPGFQHLSDHELTDIVEYLCALKK